METEAKILLTTPVVQLCQVSNVITKILVQDQMIFALLPTGQLVFLTIGEYFYTLQPQVPIYLTQFESSRSYLYDYVGEIYSIILQDSTCESYYQEIDKIFDTNALLVIKDRDGKVFENGGQDLLPQTHIQESQTTLGNLSKGVQFVGSVLSKGIKDGAQLVSDTIHDLGNFVVSKIKPGREVKICAPARWGAKIIRAASGQALIISTLMSNQIVEMNMRIAKMISRTMITVVIVVLFFLGYRSSKPSSQIKMLAQDSIAATLGILDSLDKAAIQVGLATGQQITKIVEKKYGREASGLFDQGVETYGNVGQAYRQIKKAQMKALARSAAKQTVRNFSADQK